MVWSKSDLHVTLIDNHHYSWRPAVTTTIRLDRHSMNNYLRQPIALKVQDQTCKKCRRCQKRFNQKICLHQHSTCNGINSPCYEDIVVQKKLPIQKYLFEVLHLVMHALAIYQSLIIHTDLNSTEATIIITFYRPRQTIGRKNFNSYLCNTIQLCQHNML